MFGDSLAEQIDLLVRDYVVTGETGISGQQIPFPYVLDGLDMSALDGTPPTELARHFPATELAEIGDEIADGLFMQDMEGERPLALFDGLRTDFRSEEHTSELQSLMRISYAVFCLKKKILHSHHIC